MTPGELGEAVQAAAAAALASLGGSPEAAADRAEVRRPRHREQGDYATPVALRLARRTGLPADRLASDIAALLTRQPGVERAESTGPGFVSIWLVPQASADLAAAIVAAGSSCGRSDRLAGQRFWIDPPPAEVAVTARLSVDPAPGEPAVTAPFSGDPAPGEAAVAVALSRARRASLAAATSRLLRAAGAEISSGPGPDVISLRIPGPVPTLIGRPGPDSPASPGRLASSAPALGRDPAWPSQHPIPATPGASAGRVSSGARASAEGQAGTMADLVAAVGLETASYALVSWPPGVPVVIDLGVWVRRTRLSPAWAVRRVVERIGRLAGDADGFDAGLLSADHEGSLLGRLGEFPAVVAVAGRTGEPHRLARYLEGVAAAWEECAAACPVIPRRGVAGREELVRARIVLARATGLVLGHGLRLLGVTG